MCQSCLSKTGRKKCLLLIPQWYTVHFPKHIIASSGSFLSPELQTCFSNCLLYILMWKAHAKSKLLSPVRLFATPRNSQSMEFSRPDTGVGSLSCLQGIFPTQGSNPGLPHFLGILYQLSHKGSPRILEWVAHPPFSRGSSRPRNRTGVSCTTGEFFTSWATREAPETLTALP